MQHKKGWTRCNALLISQAVRLTDSWGQTDGQTDRQADGQTDWQLGTDRQTLGTDRQTDGQTDSQADRRTEQPTDSKRASTCPLSFHAASVAQVCSQTGLLPHVNAGVMSQAELERCVPTVAMQPPHYQASVMAALPPFLTTISRIPPLHSFTSSFRLCPPPISCVPHLSMRQVSASQGLMLESASTRLMAEGGPHFDCPDKEPSARLDTLEAAGLAKVPFTSGEYGVSGAHGEVGRSDGFGA
eukprot:320782-Chlamydomonas_euryale.AAC.1